MGRVGMNPLTFCCHQLCFAGATFEQPQVKSSYANR